MFEQDHAHQPTSNFFQKVFDKLKKKILGVNLEPVIVKPIDKETIEIIDRIETEDYLGQQKIRELKIQFAKKE